MSDYGSGKQYFLVDSDQLERLILDYSPEIRHDTNRMADLIREMVDTEREKRGLDKPDGKATLELNPNKRSGSDCDYRGLMWVAGRMYTVRAWIGRDAQFINLTFELTL